MTNLRLLALSDSRRLSLAVVGVLLALLASAAKAGPYTWDVETVDPQVNASMDASIAFAPDGSAHVAAGLSGVRYGVDHGGGFTFETVPPPVLSSGTQAESPVPPGETHLIFVTTLRLALGPDGSPWIAHATVDNTRGYRGYLWVRHKTAEGWTSEYLDELRNRPALAVDATGAVHAAWVNLAGNVNYGVRSP